MRKKIIAILLCVTLMFGLAACSQKNGGTQTDSTASSEAINTSEMFTDRDKEIGYSDYVTVKLVDGGATADGTGVTVEKDTVTITEEGTYLFTGTLSNGQIVVDTSSEAKLQIVLDGVSVSNSSSAAIYIKQADKVYLTTTNGSKNTLTVTGDYVQTDDNTVDAVIYSKDDLTLNGGGTLTVQAAYGHGVVSKNDLVLTSGTYEISAAAHGLSGQDSVRIADGSFSIQSGKDGIHAENAENTSLGFLYIADGEFNIVAQTDGLSASSTLQIDAGTLRIATGGGSANATMQSREMRPGMDQTVSQNTTDENTASAKGIKATGNLIINGGTFKIDSFDDALHSDTKCYINDGAFEVSSGDDGLHADTAVAVKGGTLNITKSYEGIEGQSIDLLGGSITVVAFDDGLNAGGGADGSGMGSSPEQEKFTTDADCCINISGGQIKIDASGDGVDSNGNLTVTGGETYVSGPTNNGNGALDYAGSASISGGIFVAAGSTGMAQNFGSDSTQGSMLVCLVASQTGEISLTGESGTVLVEYTPEKQYQSVLISAPGIEKGKTYNLRAGNETQSIEMSDTIFGNGNENGMGRPGGGMQNGGKMPTDAMQGGGKRPEGDMKGNAS